MSKLSADEHLAAMRHDLAHILAAAVQQIWPEAKFGVGPVVENGFYYDIDLGPGAQLSEEDFPKVEAAMQAIIKEDQPFVRSEKPIEEALDWARVNHQPYKEELLNDLQRAGTTLAKDLNADELGTVAGSAGLADRASFYTNGNFTDLCRGPHLDSTGQAGAFKLLRVSGAYWRGNTDNPQMQRVYGAAFATPKELRQHLDMLEEARRRDHRRLGQELDLYVTSDLVGSGLPMFTPRGTVLREEVSKLSNELREARDFQKVWTPHITKKELYEKSGHWAKFGDELFLVQSQETSDTLVMKPMNCPHHTQIYASQSRSYRDLPLRYLETTTIYRDEKTGELNGLSRVRSATQDDSHVFCRPDQIMAEVDGLLACARELFTVVGMELRVRLSYRDDSDAYLGDAALWETAQNQLKDAVLANQLDYFEEAGEAAFYGPKIDFMVRDAIGREHQLSTVQIDFVQPQRFGLEYATEDGGVSQPVMIHSATLGSIERFLSVYIEHTAGKFPLWCAPEQIRLITVNQEPDMLKFAEDVRLKARKLGLRASVDDSNESVGKKIRAAEVWKVPYSLVLGERELAGGEVTPRVRVDLKVQEPSAHTLDEFLGTLAHETKARVSKTSL